MAVIPEKADVLERIVRRRVCAALRVEDMHAADVEHVYKIDYATAEAELMAEQDRVG